jgi:septal ring factor EnvC (AmiA/AmiB activator)
MPNSQSHAADDSSAWVRNRRQRFEAAAQASLDEARAERARIQEEVAKLLRELERLRAEDAKIDRQIEEIEIARAKMEAELAGFKR